MTRNTVNAEGFTLLELLIVIAIIGLLAGVLMPNLLAARVQAHDRAAQMYSASVFTGLTAVLASDPTVTADEVVGGTFNCGPEADATEQVLVAGRVFSYGWSAAPGSVEDCDVSVDSATAGVSVLIATPRRSFVNGVPTE